MIVFDTSEGQKKPQTYLNRLRRFAELKYSTSEVFQSSPTIVLSLNHISFELVPAIYNYGYQIPSPASSWEEWMSTDRLAGIRCFRTRTNSMLSKSNPCATDQVLEC
jgi:hypothetical protein